MVLNLGNISPINVHSKKLLVVGKEMIISSPESRVFTLSYDVFWLQSPLVTKYF